MGDCVLIGQLLLLQYVLLLCLKRMLLLWPTFFLSLSMLLLLKSCCHSHSIAISVLSDRLSLLLLLAAALPWNSIFAGHHSKPTCLRAQIVCTSISSQCSRHSFTTKKRYFDVCGLRVLQALYALSSLFPFLSLSFFSQTLLSLATFSPHKVNLVKDIFGYLGLFH